MITYKTTVRFGASVADESMLDSRSIKYDVVAPASQEMRHRKPYRLSYLPLCGGSDN